MSVEVVTIGESMVAFIPNSHTALRYVNQFTKVVAGAESNVAVGLVKLGHSSGWISKLGNDEFGQFILRELRGEGVDVSSVLISDTHPTGIMFKQFTNDKDSSVFYYRDNSAASTFSKDELNKQYIRDAKILLISGITPALSDSCEETTLEVMRFARKQGILVCFDPNIRRKLWSEERAKNVLEPLLALSDIVLLGIDEAELLLGVSTPRNCFSLAKTRCTLDWDQARGKGGICRRSEFRNQHFTLPCHCCRHHRSWRRFQCRIPCRAVGKQGD